LELINNANVPIAAPSANISNYISPTEAAACYTNLSVIRFMLLDGGKSTYGLESTIIDVSENIPTILRYGFITPEMISEVLGYKVLM
jgi:L-threonylcarbamoyladenylate synthase